MIADEPEFKDNCKALLMIDRGYCVPLVVNNVVLLGFELLGTHSESIFAWRFNTKKGENENKWPKQDINSCGSRTQCTAQRKVCRKLTHATFCRNRKDSVVNACTALPIVGQWDITIEPGNIEP